jgi:NAD(P)-dependent dehydrogenase (short-subunit alcohol dehydrogenase family)
MRQVRRFGRLDVLVNNAGVAGRKTVRKFELIR